MCRISADDVYFFSKILDVDKSVKELNTGLEKISQCSLKNDECLMQFNLDPNKQANEIIFFSNYFSFK